MTTTNYPARLFGGHNCGVIYDDGAGTLAILGQSLTLSSLSADLQAKWSDVVANGTPSPQGYVSTSVQLQGRAAFGGNQTGQVVGEILDQQPTWKAAVQAALAGLVAMETFDGAVGDQDDFVWGT